MAMNGVLYQFPDSEGFSGHKIDVVGIDTANVLRAAKAYMKKVQGLQASGPVQ